MSRFLLSPLFACLATVCFAQSDTPTLTEAERREQLRIQEAQQRIQASRQDISQGQTSQGAQALGVAVQTEIADGNMTVRSNVTLDVVDPDILARYDTNNDGVLSGAELQAMALDNQTTLLSTDAATGPQSMTGDLSPERLVQLRSQGVRDTSNAQTQAIGDQRQSGAFGSAQEAFMGSSDGATLQNTQIPEADPPQSWWTNRRSGKYVFDSHMGMVGLVNQLRHDGPLNLRGYVIEFWAPTGVMMHGAEVSITNASNGLTVQPNPDVTMQLNIYPREDGSRVELFYNTRRARYNQTYGNRTRCWWHESSWPWVKAFIDSLLSRVGAEVTQESLRVELGQVEERINLLQQENIDIQTTLTEIANQTSQALQYANLKAAELTTAQAILTTRQAELQATVGPMQQTAQAATAAANAAAGIQNQINAARSQAYILQGQAAYTTNATTRQQLLAQATAANNQANSLVSSLYNAQGTAWTYANQANAAYAVYQQATNNAAIAQTAVTLATAASVDAQANLNANQAFETQTASTGGSFVDSDGNPLTLPALQARRASNVQDIASLQGRAVVIQSQLGPNTLSYAAVNQQGSQYIAAQATVENAGLNQAVLGNAANAQALAPTTSNAGQNSTSLSGTQQALNDSGNRALSSALGSNAASYGYVPGSNLSVADAIRRQNLPVNLGQQAQPTLPALGGGSGRDTQAGTDDTPPPRT